MIDFKIDTNNMIQCSDCNKWIHYSCTDLPAYMLKQLCVKNRKYQCNLCICTDGRKDTKYMTTCISNENKAECATQTESVVPDHEIDEEEKERFVNKINELEINNKSLSGPLKL